MNENKRNCEFSPRERKKRKGPVIGRAFGKAAACAAPVLFGVLQGALVSLDHLLDHLAADAAGLTGGQVAVVALLQVDANLP